MAYGRRKSAHEEVLRAITGASDPVLFIFLNKFDARRGHRPACKGGDSVDELWGRLTTASSCTPWPAAGPPSRGDNRNCHREFSGMSGQDNRFAHPAGGTVRFREQLPGQPARPVWHGAEHFADDRRRRRCGWQARRSIGQSFGAVLGPMTEMAASFGAMLPRPPGGAGVADAGQAAGFRRSRICHPRWHRPACWPSGARCAILRALAELHARYQASLMQAVADRATGQAAASPAECRVPRR